jgi:NADH:ubiquinone oxidoreductase subunit 5 (subunit L)/multisubunit Na+/H+ antiporter MnhA subunit
MTTGVIALAVPLSAAFAGEFLILAGVFQQGWAWAVIGAAAIVLAAMYMLRLISAVLHQDVGSAVRGSDLRLPELGVLVPLVAALLVLSAWPAGITDRAFGGTRAAAPATKPAAKPSASQPPAPPKPTPSFEVLSDDCQAALGDPNVTSAFPKDAVATCTDASGTYELENGKVVQK